MRFGKNRKVTLLTKSIQPIDTDTTKTTDLQSSAQKLLGKKIYVSEDETFFNKLVNISEYLEKIANEFKKLESLVKKNKTDTS